MIEDGDPVRDIIYISIIFASTTKFNKKIIRSVQVSFNFGTKAF